MADSYVKATIYYLGGMGWGYKRLEARDVQYDGGSHVTCIPKGKQKIYEFPDRHSFIILDGWGHPDPPSGYTKFS